MVKTFFQWLNEQISVSTDGSPTKPIETIKAAMNTGNKFLGDPKNSDVVGDLLKNPTEKNFIGAAGKALNGNKDAENKTKPTQVAASMADSLKIPTKFELKP
jgi:hypothetical protein